MATAKIVQPRSWRRLAPIGGMGLLAMVLPPIGGLLIYGTLPVVGPWLQSQQAMGMALYIAAFVLLAGLALLPTYAQAMLGGWAFGFAWGFPAAMIGFAGGAMLAYHLGRSIAGDRLLETIERRPNLRAVHDELVGSSFWRATLIVMLVRLPPTMPFALTNVVLASAQVAWRPYLIGTLLGLGPRTAMAVFAAVGLSQLNMQDGEGNGTLLFGIAASVAAVVVIGLFARRALRRLTRRVGGEARG